MRLANIVNLGIKELRSLRRDPIMICLIVYAFTFAVIIAARAIPESLHNAPIAIVDEDHSILSSRIVNAFYPPLFTPPALINWSEMDAGMDAGRFTFALDIPPDFQRDVLAGHHPRIQFNIDATRMTQAFTGNWYVQAIVTGEVNAFLQRHRLAATLPVNLDLRVKFNPNLYRSWYTAIMELINQITTLSIVLTGAALIREREHGTIEHLLVMPVTPFEIMTSKVWSMGLVVIVASAFSVPVIVQGLLSIPITGSVLLFLAGTALMLFATTSMGILLATISRTMPQFGMLMLLVLVPLITLSGAFTPRESMPDIVQYLMLAAPNTHFVLLAQAILFRGAGLDTVWPQFLALFGIGAVLFALALVRFRKSLEAATT
jgi:ABC-2 type transport system permease protein